MAIDEVLTNHIIFRWDESSRRLFVIDADPVGAPKPIAQIEYSTLDKMSWPEASQFIGEFVTLLVPALRSRYSSEFAGSKESTDGDNA
jgi:hypothetical protein